MTETQSDIILEQTADKIWKIKQLRTHVYKEMKSRVKLFEQISSLLEISDKFGVEDSIVNNLQKSLKDYLEIVMNQNKLEFNISSETN